MVAAAERKPDKGKGVWCLISKRVSKRELRQAEAADLLNLTERQGRNLRDKVRERGRGGR